VRDLMVRLNVVETLMYMCGVSAIFYMTFAASFVIFGLLWIIVNAIGIHLSNDILMFGALFMSWSFLFYSEFFSIDMSDTNGVLEFSAVLVSSAAVMSYYYHV
jgi:hypothetical protein